VWTVEYTKRFLKDLADLPTEIKTRGNAIDFWEERSVSKLMDASQHIPSAQHSPTIDNRDRPPLP